MGLAIVVSVFLFERVGVEPHGLADLTFPGGLEQGDDLRREKRQVQTETRKHGTFAPGSRSPRGANQIPD